MMNATHTTERKATVISEYTKFEISAFNRISTVRVEKLGAGPRGEVKAVAAVELAECQCCGRQIREIHHLATGHKVGKECAGWLGHPAYRMGRKPTRKLAEFARGYGIQFVS